MANDAGNQTGGQSGAGGAGASGGNSGAAGGAGAGNGGGQATGDSWINGLTPEDKGYVELKGFKDPASVVNSYRNLEKLHGVPKERLLKLPEKMDDDAAMAEVFNRLGRPEKPEGYELKEFEAQNKDLAAWVRSQFHGLGLTKAQGEKFAKAWLAKTAESLTAEHTAAETAAKEAAQQQQAKLKETWGAAFDQNSKVVADFKKAIGMDPETAAAFDQALGADVSAKFLHAIVEKFGIKLGEDTYRGDEGGGGNSFGILSPDAARARLEELKSDQTWIQQWYKGDQAKRAEFDRLTRWANGVQ